jgi:hypothetical protein
MNDRILILDDGAIDPRGRLDSHRKHRPPKAPSPDTWVNSTPRGYGLPRMIGIPEGSSLTVTSSEGAKE